MSIVRGFRKVINDRSSRRGNIGAFIKSFSLLLNKCPRLAFSVARRSKLSRASTLMNIIYELSKLYAYISKKTIFSAISRSRGLNQLFKTFMFLNKDKEKKIVVLFKNNVFEIRQTKKKKYRCT